MIESNRNIYEKQLLLEQVGILGQKKLLSAKVAVIGAGGLGCPALLHLAAAGVGEMHIIDGDRVSLSNLHRQFLYGIKDVGQLKVDIAQEHLNRQHPHLNIQGYSKFLSPENAKGLISGVDLVIDCTDNFAARYLINDVCVQLEKPFVYGAIFKFEGQVAVFNHGDSSSYRCLFPEYPKAENQPNCSETGVLGILPGIIGTMQATEAIKWIVGMEGLLDSSLLTYNAIQQEIRKINLPKRNLEICSKVKAEKLRWHPESCNTDSSIEWEMLLASDEFKQIVDVRELEETPQSPEFTTHKIPFGELNKFIAQLQPEIPTAIYCQSGFRSEKATILLRNRGFEMVRSIVNGLDALPKLKENYS